MKRLILGSVCAFIIGSPAFAQSSCGPYDAVRKAAREKFHMVTAGVGIIRGNNRILEFLVNKETNEWGALIVAPDRNGQMIACVILEGDSWTDIKPPKPRPKGQPF